MDMGPALKEPERLSPSTVSDQDDVKVRLAAIAPVDRCTAKRDPE
jgi:hypothetical protein